jgi:hypothetical protein
MGAEAAVATASALEEPATAVGCRALGAVDQAGKLFGEALVDDVEESSGPVAQHDSASFFDKHQSKSHRRKFFGRFWHSE